MKTLILTSLFLILSTTIYCQNTVDALIILKTNDTLCAKVKVRTNLFNKKLINELSFYRKLRLITKKANLKIKEKDVKYLEFTDFYNNIRIFKSGSSIPNFENKYRLFEEKIKGKISWYRVYSPHPYDGSVQSNDYYVIDKKLPIHVGLFNSRKKKLMKLIGGTPEIDILIENVKTDEDILEIMKKYNYQ